MAMSSKRLLRAVIRKVHPDLFSTLPFERSHNSDNLKLLNQYVDALAQDQSPGAVDISFWVKGSLQLERVDARLDGGLGNLYLAFGLITDEEWETMQAQHSSGVNTDDTNFLDWLRETVADAVATADEHEYLKKLVREMKAAVEYKYGLAAIRVGNSYSCTTIDLSRQLECLRVFEAFLLETDVDCRGLTFQLYHPWSAPSRTYTWMGQHARPRMEASVMNAHVAADGSMHIIADRSSIMSQIASLDVSNARTLASVNSFWGRRQRDLLPTLRATLRVANVWCDNRSNECQEAFVLWAGRIVNAAKAFDETLGSRSFSFSLLVHSDATSPLIDYMATSSVLQVRADCAPQLLQDFLASETADEAENAASTLTEKEDEEAALLAEVKRVFDAKHVIRVCSTEHKVQAMNAARKLIAEAETIKGRVNLANASIAIDDCYQVWESGFISIPHTFEVADLSPKLAVLMAGRGSPGEAEAEGAAARRDSTRSTPLPRRRRGAGSSRGLSDARGGNGARMHEATASEPRWSGASVLSDDVAAPYATPPDATTRGAGDVTGLRRGRGLTAAALPAVKAAGRGGRSELASAWPAAALMPRTVRTRAVRSVVRRSVAPFR